MNDKKIIQPVENPSTENLRLLQIQQLVADVAKRTNHRYRHVVDKKRNDSWAYRQDKVWQRMRFDWSLEAFKSARREFWQMHIFQQHDFIERMEKYFADR